jgi:hypothetical protein
MRVIGVSGILDAMVLPLLMDKPALREAELAEEEEELLVGVPNIAPEVVITDR